MLTCIEICAGAGGQALGLDLAGFKHLALVENDETCARTVNSIKKWKKQVVPIDVDWFRAEPFKGQGQFGCGGRAVPSVLPRRQAARPRRRARLFPAAIRIVKECKPHAVLFENVRGLLHPRFHEYRKRKIERPLRRAGYVPLGWRVVEARNFGVPQLRPRAVLVALRPEYVTGFDTGARSSGHPADW